MGVRVERGESRVDFSDEEWQAIFELARLHGWIAAGTLPPSAGGGAEWSGEYWPPCGQQVAVEDAALLAEATARALSAGCEPGSPAAELDIAWNRILGTMDRFLRTGRLVDLLRGGGVALLPARQPSQRPPQPP